MGEPSRTWLHPVTRAILILVFAICMASFGIFQYPFRLQWSPYEHTIWWNYDGMLLECMAMLMLLVITGFVCEVSVRRMWRLHLVTAIFVTFVLGVILGLNLIPRSFVDGDQWCGWPSHFYFYRHQNPGNEWDYLSLIFDALVGVFITIPAACVCEWIARWKIL